MSMFSTCTTWLDLSTKKEILSLHDSMQSLTKTFLTKFYLTVFVQISFDADKEIISLSQ